MQTLCYQFRANKQTNIREQGESKTRPARPLVHDRDASTGPWREDPLLHKGRRPRWINWVIQKEMELDSYLILQTKINSERIIDRNVKSQTTRLPDKKYKRVMAALAERLGWWEHRSRRRAAAGLPPVGGRTRGGGNRSMFASHTNVSLSPSLPTPHPHLSQINKNISSGED